MIKSDRKKRTYSSKDSNKLFDDDYLASVDDSFLIEKVLQGEKRFYNEIVNRYEHLIYQYSLRMCGNPADAEDTLQETFLNAFRALDNFRAESKLSTWLYKIANNSCLMKKRKSKFAPEKELSLSEITFEKEIESINNWRPQIETPMDNLLNKEFIDTLQNIVLELPQNYRKVFILADLQGFKGQEIADIIGISLPSVKSRLHRARLYIRNKLSEYLEVEVHNEL